MACDTYPSPDSSDNNLTLNGFRRFKTTHLLNLQLLENVIAEMDHVIYQAGLSLGLNLSSTDQLGLKHGKRDANAPNIGDTVTKEFILKLRDLIRQYDEALGAFNNIMTMETFSLLDDEKQSSLLDDLNLHERLSRKSQNNNEGLGSFSGRRRWSYQNTILIADIIGRITTATFTAIFLVAPLAILSHQSSKHIQLVVVSVCILSLSFLVSLFFEARYAAVLSVFVSNVPAWT
ncbi:hypothetical protein GQ44DRAFT_740640 [Phaeosphaeriaceae sp. PMI808]|nr:hypothetical protein GQ44DRAFT_740640 [Phaeosphaeriaceae sp. PMI808]